MAYRTRVMLGGGGGHFHAYRQSDMPPHAPVSWVRRRNERLTVRSSLDREPFSGVEIHLEMDMEWKWMEMGQNL